MAACTLEAAPLKQASDWIGDYRQFWEESFERLDEYLKEMQRRKRQKKEKKIMANKTEIIAEPGKQELFIKREFDAPRELVFRAHVDPEIYVKWCGPVT
jgi:hypothetical protein